MTFNIIDCYPTLAAFRDEPSVVTLQLAIDWLAEHGNGDPEAGHSHEDHLYELVLKYVASGRDYEQAKTFAEMVLTCADLDFPRWYA